MVQKWLEKVRKFFFSDFDEWSGVNLRFAAVCIQKLVFSSKIENGGVAVLAQGGRDPQNWYAPNLPSPKVIEWAKLEIWTSRSS